MDYPLRGASRAVPLTLELAQTVAIGAFNPYVITPDWLVKYGICLKDDLNVRLVAIGEGAAFQFGPVEWQVDNRRLSVSSAQRDADCGGMVSRVLSLLPHTPVQAVGHNFHFTAAKDEYGRRPAPMLGLKALADFEDAEQVRWVGMFRHGDARIEVTLAYEADAVAILLNHNRNMDLELARRAPTADDQIAPAKVAAERFRDDFAHSLGLLRSLFEWEMPDE